MMTDLRIANVVMHDKDERIEWETLRFTQVMFSDRRTKVRFDVNAC